MRDFRYIHSVVIFTTCFHLFGAVQFCAGIAADRPNILLIMADDLGFSDLGCYGGEIATPNLDSVASSGLRFSQFYNTARCWPTRAALLTGFYAQQVRRDFLPGVPSGGGKSGTRPDWAVLLPKLLKSSGYRSYHTGKWHIDGMPVENGFDRSYYLGDQGRFFNPVSHWKDDVKLPPVEKNSGYYSTRALADHAIEVLKEHAAEHGDRPFFHYLAFSAPHFPLHALPEDIALYRDTYEEGWGKIRQKRWKRMEQMGLLDSATVGRFSKIERDLGPPYHFPKAFEVLGAGEVNKPIPWKKLTKEQQAFQATKMAIHAAMIHRMDIEIGRVLNQIKQMGKWENTLVIFLSDNGASAEVMVRDDGHDPNLPPGSAGTHLCLGPGWSTVSNTPFRRHKTWTHEGGISTPFICSWPNGIGAVGEIRRTPGHVIDIVPTILELAGAKMHERSPVAPGKSLVPLFSADGTVDRSSLWWFHDGHKAIRMGDWKAVAAIDEPWELYNLANGRAESVDLAVPQPSILKRLVKEWDRSFREFIELASVDLSVEELEKNKDRLHSGFYKAQMSAKPKRRQVLLSGESYMLKGRRAFLMTPENVNVSAHPKPWIFYAVTLNKYPDEAERWMHRQFLDAGVAVAGIDVGEAYGSPHAFPFFEALYQEMEKRGYSGRPACFARSRGGLWVMSWTIEHPDRVAGIGGIYPVWDYTTYPGVDRAAPAYGLTRDELLAQENKLNPILRATKLADAKIPVFIIHGDNDTVVPIAPNARTLKEIYEVKKAANLIKVIESEGQGHSFWEGFFQCQELVDFLIENAKLGS